MSSKLVASPTALAARIQAAHEAAQSAMRSAVSYAFEAGKLLMEAKKLVGHGNWESWVRESCGFSERTAQGYMRLARLDPEKAQRVALLSLRDALKALAGSKGEPASLPYSENPEWYTPHKYIEAARQVLGNIDLDPASNDIAQQMVRASTYYTAETDGLVQEWRGRTWVNPPYSKNLIAPFVRKLLDEYRDGNVPEAVLLTHARTDAGWFHEAADAAAAICFTCGRISFRTRNGTGNSPTDGSVFFYFGLNLGRFAVVFGSFGLVYGPPMQVHRRPMLEAAA
jgi:phage N-6-adenine-methyltransferase